MRIVDEASLCGKTPPLKFRENYSGMRVLRFYCPVKKFSRENLVLSYSRLSYIQIYLTLSIPFSIIAQYRMSNCYSRIFIPIFVTVYIRLDKNLCWWYIFLDYVYILLIVSSEIRLVFCNWNSFQIWNLKTNFKKSSWIFFNTTDSSR